MWEDILDFVFGLLANIGSFASWLTTPISVSMASRVENVFGENLPSWIRTILETMNYVTSNTNNTLLTFTPIHILTGGLFATIIVLWVVKLINPLS